MTEQNPVSAAPLRWGILGTGEIADVFARDVAGGAASTVVAVGSRTSARAAAFARDLGEGVRPHGSYAELIEDPEVEAVYIATPHSEHAEWAVRAARAGRHVLCEKPLTVSHPEAMVVVEEARRAGVCLAEALMYRLHPQTLRLVELVREGAVGEVKLIRAGFTFDAGDLGGGHRLLDPRLGGGAILDVGVYPASFALLVAAAALGEASAVPLEVRGSARRHPVTGVDTYAVASLRFPGEIVAELTCGIDVAARDEVAVYGTEGVLRIETPAWLYSRSRGGESEIVLERAGEPADLIALADPGSSYRLEADAVARVVREARVAASDPLAVPGLPLDDTLATLNVLDRWGRAAGVRSGRERAARGLRDARASSGASDRRPAMPMLTIPGLPRPVSRLALGCDNQPSDAHLEVLLEHFIERGGNVVDTAFNYDAGMCGGDDCERRLGRWLRSSGARDEVTILTKGAHTPDCFPGVVRPQLLQSLERLGTDAVDIYLLHRDNPEVPVGEFVDALHQVWEEGLTRLVGVSNWSRERLQAARAYAVSHGRRVPSVVSNQFSLAEMNAPLWSGSHSASAADWRDWLHGEGDLTLVGWSSLARGYLVAGEANGTDDPERQRVWESEINRTRRARVAELAARRGVPAAAVAVAYVLSQPFPSIALIGPRTLSEQLETLRALEVELLPEDVAYLLADDHADVGEAVTP